MTMILRSTLTSPFGRKVRMAIHHLGLQDQFEIVPASTADPDDTLRQQNPLGKMPTLILDDGTVMFDSRVILDYIDGMAGGGRLIPAKGDARHQTLTLAALADGIIDAALLITYEARFRTEDMRSETFLTHQRDKIIRALVKLEANPPAIEPVTVGTMGLACAFGYLDWRKALDWRADYPALVDWHNRFAAAVPAFAATEAPKG
ncbi:MAG: glutathione S-transferase N-terminal domain-containing protein [Alphaproteobacteria bacterium]